MLELAFNSEMAVKLIVLKRQAETELGQRFSIADEASIEHLLLASATFKHKHSKARLYALELVDGIETLDAKGRHTVFIANCRGQLKQLDGKAVAKKIYRGNEVLENDEFLETHSCVNTQRIYRGQKVLPEQVLEGAAQPAEKALYYRGQKIIPAV